MKKNSLLMKTSLCLTTGIFAFGCMTDSGSTEKSSDFAADIATDTTTDAAAEERFAIELEQLAPGFESATAADNTAFLGRVRIPTFFTLAVALREADLLGAVTSNQLTIFAPTDRAFARLGIHPWNVGEVENLSDILLYHVVPGQVLSSDLREGFAATLNGAAVEVNFDRRRIFIDDARVRFADLRLFDDTLHVIDRVLLPPAESIVDVVVGNDDFSILKDALLRTGLVGAFDGTSSFTVFAPTNDAFVALLGELGVASLDDISDEVLAQVLLYHVVDGRVFSSDLSDELEVSPLSGGIFRFDLDAAPTIIDENRREVGLVPSLLDVQTSDGVIHVIDRVLLPVL